MRRYSRNSEGTMKDGVEAAIQELWKEEEEGQAWKSDGNQTKVLRV